MGAPAQHFDLQIIRSWRNEMQSWAMECSLNGKYSGLDGVDSGSYFGPGIALNAVPTGFKCSSLQLPAIQNRLIGAAVEIDQDDPLGIVYGVCSRNGQNRTLTTLNPF